MGVTFYVFTQVLSHSIVLAFLLSNEAPGYEMLSFSVDDLLLKNYSIALAGVGKADGFKLLNLCLRRFMWMEWTDSCFVGGNIASTRGFTLTRG